MGTMRFNLAFVRSIVAGLLLSDSSCCLACPFCQTETGRQVARGNFDNFWSNALLALAPFPFLFLVVGLIQFGLPRPRRRKRDE
jgi:hypothetical protein